MPRPPTVTNSPHFYPPPRQLDRAAARRMIGHALIHLGVHYQWLDALTKGQAVLIPTQVAQPGKDDVQQSG